MAAGTKKSLLQGRWTVWILSLAFSLLAGFGVLTIIGSSADQVTYYVMSEDVPAGTQLSDANITSRVTDADGVPPQALPLSVLQSAPLFTIVPLSAGDVISDAVVGPGERIVADIPESYVAASLAVEPQNAAGGQIRAGDFVDVAAVEGNGRDMVSRVVLHNVLVLDVAASPQTIARAANTNSISGETEEVDINVLRDGLPSMYTFAVSPQDFAVMALLRDKDVSLAISQGQSSTPIDASANAVDVFTPGPIGATDASVEVLPQVPGDLNTDPTNTDPGAQPTPTPTAAVAPTTEPDPAADTTADTPADPSASPTPDRAAR